MLTCRACLRRAVSSLYDHALSVNVAIAATTTTSSRPNRTYATAAAHDTVLPDRSNRATDDVPSPGTSAPTPDQFSTAVGPSAEWAARKELQYLSDPLHIANRVRRALDSDDFDHAAMITRQASKSHKVEVSWNHLIDYQLKHDRLAAALKLYNEMKKRGQLPNAQTFTIFFRGCARTTHKKKSLAEAIKLYNTMLSVGRIKPNTVHLNAVLHVCAQAEDIEAMFSVLQSSEDATRPTNNLTYTTILNALRAHADKYPSTHLTEEMIEEGWDVAVKRAKMIWEEVISRWRTGSVTIDEELVCAMGRILLKGHYNDTRLIEDLLDQTMNLPPVASPMPTLLKPKKAETGDDAVASTEQQPIAAPPQISASTQISRGPANAYARPGRNSLSLILASLEKTRRTTHAMRYWGLFTKRYGVVPDADNYTQLLRVFSCGKSSAKTAAYLVNIPPNMLNLKHVRIAMKTCIRDNLNRSAFHNATGIFEIMCKNFSIPDILTMRMYLQFAHAHKRSYDRQLKADHEGAMGAWARELTIALDKLWGPYQVLAKKCIVKHTEKVECDNVGEVQNLKAEVVALARKMIAAADILVMERLVPVKVSDRLKKQRNALNRFVVTHFAEVQSQKSERHERRERDRREPARADQEEADDFWR
ncbi:hypothetical protein F5Y18DRAFT_222632 [Xylariaceae sp. FL1019]|nr:hypothetical protein F5Y18DRAFT_222632 [Xylariaceae sp. FL1019]